jgi:hypothetical protein
MAKKRNYGALLSKLKIELTKNVTSKPTKNQRLKRRTNQLKLLDLCKFKDFKTLLTFKSSLKLNQFVIKYIDKKITLLQKQRIFPWLHFFYELLDIINSYKQCMQHVKLCVKYLKVMLEVFGLEYVDIEDNLTNCKVKKILK